MLGKLALFLFPRVIHWLTWLIVLTCRIKIHYEATEIWSPLAKAPGPGRIYACWHGQLLLCTFLWRGNGVHVVVSQSRDGEYLARVLRRWGYLPLRGSSSRGGAAVYRESLLLLKKCEYLAIAPDGPRGPRHAVNPGVVHLALRTGAPIVPMASCASKTWRLSSWDRFEVPLPFSTIAVLVGAPLYFPDTRDDAAVRGNEERLKEVLNGMADRVRAKALEPGPP